MSNPMQAQAAANVMSEQRSYRRVEYAITGDTETDFIAGCVALVADQGNNLTRPTLTRIARAFEYLAVRYHERAQIMKEREEESRYAQTHAMQGLPSKPEGPPKYWTSSGTTAPNTWGGKNLPPLIASPSTFIADLMKSGLADEP